ncbi:hypothetical protein G0Q06_08465 [Puniceicoccales bacterium CK1056]|uniref:Uncharacterized protein n=1 Tax=Oceanipulchritudo coccoides TaxID=2706888 RepID=A0A6B2M4B0_9BACT|nr:hypothetical protein [Oceanipulchritudo coccoides]NDV62480.1 hypothetical protein [Oceanipulchritudo coccoides]
MQDRRPRETRFESGNPEARLALLREQAPTLGTNRKLRAYAILGSLLMVLTVAAFYFAIQIYKAAAEDESNENLIEVDQAPEITETETQKAVARIEAEEAALEEELKQQLEELKTVDLLGND